MFGADHGLSRRITGRARRFASAEPARRMTSMNRRGKVFALSTTVLGIVVLAGAGIAGRVYLQRIWYGWCLESGDAASRTIALRWLAERLDSAAWQQVDCGGFSLRLPPAYTPIPSQGTDSQVEHWSAGPLRELSCDYGAYSASLDDVGFPSSRCEWTETASEHSMKIVAGWKDGSDQSSEESSFWVAATWRNVRPGLHLTFHGATPDRAEQPTLVAIYRTVRFKP